jgi:hypothetical protein
MNLDNLNQLLQDSGVPEDVIKTIKTDIGGQVKADLADDPNLAYLNNINDAVSSLNGEGGLNATLANMNVILSGWNSGESGLGFITLAIAGHLANLEDANNGTGFNVNFPAAYSISNASDIASALSSVVLSPAVTVYPTVYADVYPTVNVTVTAPGAEYGGIMAGSQSGHLATLHGTELVVSPKASYPATVKPPQYENTQSDNDEIKGLLKELITAVKDSKGEVVIENRIDLDKFDSRAKVVYDEMRVKVDNRGQRVTGRRMIQ